MSKCHKREMREMSRRLMLTGTVGGVIGTITGSIGILWIATYFIFLNKLSYEYTFSVICFLYLFGPFIGQFFFPSLFPAFLELVFLILTILLGISLIITSIMVGLGFYGLSEQGAGGIGGAALITGVSGTSVAAILLVLADTVFREFHLSSLYLFYYPYYYYPIYLYIYTPGSLFIWYSLIVLGITFFVLGLVSVLARDSTPSLNSAVAAGILSIIGGILLIQCSYTFILTNFSLIIPGYLYLGIPSFATLIACGIFWAYMFHSSK